LVPQLHRKATTKEAVEPNEFDSSKLFNFSYAVVPCERRLESPSLTFPPSLASFKKRSQVGIAFLALKLSHSNRHENLTALRDSFSAEPLVRMLMRQMSKKKWIAVALLCAACAHGQIRYVKLPPEKIAQRLEAAADNQAERGAYLRTQFQTAGCMAPNLKDEVVPHQKLPNIVCVIPGKTARKIVVGAHYDFVADGRGIVDNWSGAALLPSFVESLKDQPREHTFVFIAFTGEERGMLGSKSYVSQLSNEQRKEIDAMVNLDTLGLSTTKVWASDSSTPLVKALFSVASMINSPLAVMNVDGMGQSDNDTFRVAKIPEICVHSVTQDTMHVIHSHNDQLSAIRRDDYYESYRLMAAYLASIDASFTQSPGVTPDQTTK